MDDTAIQTIPSEVEVEYDVELLTLIGNYTQVTFELEPRKSMFLPSSLSLVATQKGNQLNKKTKKSYCRVYKGKEFTEGILINQKTALNGDVSFVLLVSTDNKTVKINKPDKIVLTDESVEIQPNLSKGKVKINMVLEDAILFDFKHHVTKASEYYLLETLLILNNESKYRFKRNNSTKILVPTEGEETTQSSNIALMVNNVGDINSFSKENIVISSLRLDEPVKYYLLSLLKPHVLTECLEFELKEMLPPGELFYVDDKGTSYINRTDYKNSGDKLRINLDERKDIDIVSLQNGEDFSIILELDEDKHIKLAEFRQVKYIMFDNKICTSDRLFIEKGRHIISGKY
jgi:hypothetical protein